MTSIESVTLEVADPTAASTGVSPGGTGSHRLMIASDAGPFTDPDGFAWQAARISERQLA